MSESDLASGEMDVAAIPIKPFGLAKERLAAAFDSRRRDALGRATARHTIEVVAKAVGSVWVVTADVEVAAWADRLGASIIFEHPDQKGLNAAADRVVEESAGSRWLIIHADLPLLRVDDVRGAWSDIPSNGLLLAPSHDGGTSAFGGRGTTASFAYGPGSFRRHLGRNRQLPLQIVTRTGFLLDLDAPTDYQAAVSHPRGSWLGSIARR